MAAKAVASARAAPVRRGTVKASASQSFLQQAGKVAVSLGAALSVSAGAAVAGDYTVKAGDDDGSLVFVPSSITIKAGETVDFVNNKAGPHNIAFDEDGVPSGVDPDSLTYEDYMNSPGEVQSLTFKTPGTYNYICTPHAGAGMGGTVIVKE